MNESPTVESLVMLSNARNMKNAGAEDQPNAANRQPYSSRWCTTRNQSLPRMCAESCTKDHQTSPTIIKDEELTLCSSTKVKDRQISLVVIHPYTWSAQGP